ncbi:MAG TPA: GNAT family N-acetyltransferase [Chloroflexia bacterium]|nr:GNAT family N-acetyltransferase [Chloroflexia bacterium]
MSALPRAGDPTPPPRPYDPRAVEIRLGAPRAWPACLAIDDGYTTSRMWQPVGHTLDDSVTGLTVPGGGRGETDAPFSVTFQPLRLPRPIQEPGLFTLRAPEARMAAWDAAACVLVAGPPRPAPADPPTADAEVPLELWAYVVLNGVPGAGLAWIAELVVAGPHRRRGLGRMLLDAARAWARSAPEQGGAGGLRALMVELSPRNYPAIAFCRGAGFRFAGYTDYTLTGGDIRLFFIRPTD